MSIKVRCTECRKKLSVDEAFVGGTCRCPYCRELFVVTGRAKAARVSDRPEAPPARGEASQQAPPNEAAREAIPLAAPAEPQRAGRLILLGVLLALAALAVVYLTTGGKGPIHPFHADSVPLVSPVVYCIDAGSSMSQTFDHAGSIALAFIRSDGAAREFTIVVSQEQEDVFMAAGYHAGGPQGQAVAEEFLRQTIVAGASNLPRALSAALDRQPGTIVLFARKHLPADRAAEALQVASQAAARNVRIVTITIDADETSVEAFGALAKVTGGLGRAYSSGEVERLLKTAPSRP